MNTVSRPTRNLVYSLVCVFAFTGFMSQSTMASIVGTDTVMTEHHASAARAEIDAVLDRHDVQALLVDYGVEPAEAADRVAALTDQEALELAHNMESLPAGGSVGLLLVIIILILLLR